MTVAADEPMPDSDNYARDRRSEVISSFDREDSAHIVCYVARPPQSTGIYEALFDARLREAERRGYAVVCVDASSMSRPILEHIGFEVICATVPMQWRSR